MDLHQETLDLLLKDERPRDQIAYEAGVSPSWLFKFFKGRISNPGLLTVQKLHDYLSNGRSRKPKRD